MYMHLTTQNRNMVLSEFPQDDPFGGPAYGQFNKSKGLGKVLGVVAGVASAMTGFGMVGMAGGLKGLGTIQGLAGGAMAAGGVAQAIGAATGNKKLARIGGTLSLAGGVGSMAGDLVSGGMGAVGSSMKEGMSSTMDKFTSAFQKVTGGSTAAGAAPPNMPLAEGGGVTNALGAAPQAGTEGILAQQMSSPGMSAAGPNMSLDPSAGGALPSGPMSSPGVGGLSAADTSRFAGGGNLNLPAATQQAGGGATGILGKAMEFAQTPGGMNLVGNALMGMGGSEEAKVAQQKLDFMKEQHKDSRDDLERELKNLNFRYEIIDPFAPDAEQKRAAARAAGIPTIDLGANPNAGPVMTQGVSMPTNNFVPAGV